MSSWLWDRLARHGDAPAFFWRGTPTSYRDLNTEVGRWLTSLEEAGVPAGACLAVLGDFSPGIAAFFVAAVCRGLVIAPLPRLAPSALPFYLRTSRADAFLDFNDTDRPTISRLESPPDHPLLDRLRSAGCPGLVIFSSGTTGIPKASLLNTESLLEKFKVERKPIRALSFLLLDHVGGVNTLFTVLSCGGLLVCPERRDPDTICRLVREHRVQLLPVTPTFLKMMLISDSCRLHDLSSLETISFGAEPMPQSTLRALREALPWVSFRQLYGLTELGVLPARSDPDDPLWLRFSAGVETKVVNGTLRVRSPAAMLGYLNAEPPFDAEGWFDTQDAVEIEGDRVRVLGRVSDLINVGGEKVYPAEVEDVVMQMDGVRDALVYGKASPVTGQVVAVRVWLVRPQEPERFSALLRQFCRGRLAPHQTPMFVEVVHGPSHAGRFKKSRQPGGMSPGVPQLPDGTGELSRPTVECLPEA